jgi:glycosyltransferase involved in cell wall biosynthesis
MIDVVWRTSIDPSGYSSCARSYVKALYSNKKVNVKVIVDSVARNINAVGIDPSDLLFFSSITVPFPPNGFLDVNHSVPDRMVFGVNKNILYTVAEMDVPHRWVYICNKCDLIMTASSFCKSKLVECGVKEDIVEVVPHCHDTKVWNKDVLPIKINNLKEFNFLFIGDYTPRKNGDLLVESFIKTFSGNKNVSLTIKGYFNSFSLSDQKKLIQRIQAVAEGTGIPKWRRPTIYFYGEPIIESLMPNFMASFDCLISPHRCEGWGLCASLMQMLHKPVIATKFSGNLDFMDDESSYLININGFEDVCDEMSKINPNFEGKQWAKINKDMLCDTMKHVYDNQDEAKKRGELAGIRMAERFSYEVVSDILIEKLERIN